jgi:ADP-ribose pyrophosphatase YjhB (NUDIX family)
MTKVKADSIDWLSFTQSLQAIAQTGLSYSKDHYDLERYQEMLNIVSKQYSDITGTCDNKINKTLFDEVGYATPKICVRALCLKNDKILLVKERQEELWSLPGGWADVNLSPGESLLKELKEETGFDGSIERLLSLWDKRKHEHPPHWPHTYLAFYYCKLTGGEFTTSHEISEIGFFNLNNLPKLSTHRVTKTQLYTLVDMVKNDLPASFD